MAQVFWAMKIKALTTLIFSLTYSQLAFSTPLPSDHFLAPRDVEVMWISGIETPANARALAREYEKCHTSKAFNSCEWFETFEKMEVTELSTHDFISRAQVTFFGERHIDQLNQKSMAQIIKNSKGLDVLALEMFNVSDQAALDSYLSGELSFEGIKEVLNHSWNYNDEGYLEMIKAAKEMGVKILAIDERSLFDALPFSENLIERDKHMANVLSVYLKENPTDNIFVYTGKMHSFKSLSKESNIQSVTQILEKEITGLSVKNYFLFAKKENALPLHSMRIVSQNRDQVVVESEALKPYVDGAVFLSL